MFNINSAVQIVLDAEKVYAAQYLTSDEKTLFLEALRDSVPEGIAGLPPACLAARRSIQRMILLDNDHSELALGRTGNATEAQKQGRKTKGRKEPTEVAPEGAEEGTEEASGPPEGVEQA